MKTAIDFLEDLKAKNNGASDYKVSKILGVTQQTVSHWRTGRSLYDDTTAIQIAKLLEIEPAIIVSAVHAERAKNDSERMVWDDIYKRLGGMAAALMLAFGLVTTPADVQANPLPNASQCALC